MQISSQNRYRELLEELFRRETENGLFDLSTEDGIHFWDLVRNDVFTYAMSHAGIMPLMDFVPLNTTGNRKMRLKGLAFLPISWFHAMTRKKQSGTVLTLNISRSWSNEKNGFTDLLFSDIHTALGKRCFHLELFTPSKKEVLKWKNRSKHFLIDLEIKKLLTSYRCTENLPEITCFKDVLPDNFPLTDVIRVALFHYRTELPFYRKLLQKKGIKQVMLQSQPKSLIAAAHELGLPTYDLQHGHFNNFDPFYSYHPSFDTNVLETVVQNLMTVGNYWNQFVHPTIKATTIGSSYFFPPAPSNDKKHILIIGSRFIHTAILEELKSCAVELPDERFVYKLHSNQNDQLESTCAFFAENPNVEIRIFDDINTLLPQTKWLVLVQSTVAYQALQMGIPVCIYKKYYYEASEDLFLREDVVLVDSLREFAGHLKMKSANVQRQQTTYFEHFQSEILFSLSVDLK